MQYLDRSVDYVSMVTVMRKHGGGLCEIWWWFRSLCHKWFSTTKKIFFKVKICWFV